MGEKLFIIDGRFQGNTMRYDIIKQKEYKK